MPNYKVKEGHAINIQTGSRKIGDKKTVRYEGGKSVSLTPEQALSHASVLELSKEDIEKLESKVVEPEPAEKKK